MERERPEIKFEIEKEVIVAPPAIESFNSVQGAKEFWPEVLSENQEFLNQIESRNQLSESINEVASALPRPDIALGEAVEQGYLTEQQVIDLYNTLGSQMKTNPDLKRLTLYFPFEFLPDFKKQQSVELQTAAEKFRDSYMEAWQGLLETHDVRANFVDGDLLEYELREEDVPRVVKAAHLLPKLVEKGMVDAESVLDLLKSTDEPVLKESLADALLVMADAGLVNSSEIEIPKDDSYFTVESINRELGIEFELIEHQLYPKNTTEARAKWLAQEQKREVIENLSSNITDAILTEQLPEDKSWDEFVGANSRPDVQQVFVSGVRKAIESIAYEDVQKAQELYGKFEPLLRTAWGKGNAGVRNSIAKTFSRLYGLKVVSSEQLAEMGIRIPKLEGSATDNLVSIEEETKQIKEMVQSIETDPELSKYVYPIALMYGSNLKGYGDSESDIDIMVMIKPGTDFKDKETVKQLLSKTFSHEKIHGDIMQFWLQEDSESEMSIINFDDFDHSLGSSEMVNMLFSAVWTGNESLVKDLREKLLVPYLKKDESPEGIDTHRMQLEDMERENLQYRLMHKGYEKLFPAYGGIKTPHASHIDGHSMFYDSGYRTLATKLFANKVFLPKV